MGLVTIAKKLKHENGGHFEIQFGENRTSFYHPILGGGVHHNYQPLLFIRILTLLRSILSDESR